MVHFEIESNSVVTIDGIGLLEPGKKIIVDEDMLRVFKTIHQVGLLQAAFPPNITVTAVVDAEEV